MKRLSVEPEKKCLIYSYLPKRSRILKETKIKTERIFNEEKYKINSACLFPFPNVWARLKAYWNRNGWFPNPLYLFINIYSRRQATLFPIIYPSIFGYLISYRDFSTTFHSVIIKWFSYQGKKHTFSVSAWKKPRLDLFL